MEKPNTKGNAMSTKRIPTFRVGGKLLTGADAAKAWAEQSGKCNCGSHGTQEDSISGECGGMPATWLGCSNCTGEAVGRPLVYRMPSQMK